MTELTLERRNQPDLTQEFYLPNGEDGKDGVMALFTPPISADYWEYRVVVGDGQAVVGFPKFTTIGVGFAVEDDDWNTNLPYTMDADEIVNHIWKNRGPNVTDRALVLAAVKLVQAAATADRLVEQ